MSHRRSAVTSPPSQGTEGSQQNQHAKTSFRHSLDEFKCLFHRDHWTLQGCLTVRATYTTRIAWQDSIILDGGIQHRSARRKWSSVELFGDRGDGAHLSRASNCSDG